MADIQLTQGLAQGIKNVLQVHPELRQGITFQGTIMQVEDRALPALSNFLRALPGGGGRSGVLGKVADVVDRAMSTRISNGALSASQVMGMPESGAGAQALQYARMAAGVPASPVNAPAMTAALNNPAPGSALANVAQAAVETGAATPGEAAAATAANAARSITIPGAEGFVPRALSTAIPGAEGFTPRLLGGATAPSSLANAGPAANLAPNIGAELLGPTTPTALLESAALKQLGTKEMQQALVGGRLKSLLAAGPNRVLSAGEQAAKSALMSGATAEEAIAAANAAKGLPAWLSAGSAGRAGAYGLGGQIASSLLRSSLGGERDAATFLGATGQWDNAAEDALSLGGTGAGIGSMIAPGVGTAIGAIVGGGAGFIKGWLGGQDSQPKQIRDYLAKISDYQSSTSLATRLTAAGIDMNTVDQILGQIAAASTVAKNKSEVESIVASIIPRIGSLGQQQVLYNDAIARQQANAAYVQSNLMPAYNESLSAMGRDARAWATAQGAAAQGFSNKALGNIYAANALQAPLAADKLAASMQGQLAALYQMRPVQPTGFYPDIFGNSAAQLPATPAAPNLNMGILAGAGLG